jgi:para-nitrobenzyl esterase
MQRFCALQMWLWLLLFGCVNAASPKVSIPNVGTVVGKISTFSADVALYNGIPYAKPPVKDLRWQPPVRFGPIGDNFNATTLGNQCMQVPKNISRPTAISENCLFLNVAAPLVRQSSSLPVLVWIHGGAYVSGSSNEYTPDTIVARSSQSVVVVTLNYRLNIFGFLGSTQVAVHTSDGSAGNFGIQDQRMAMQWVKDNIAAFGGDAGSITIFGESAGGNSVFNHLAQPLSFSLYTRAIIESGVYNSGAFSMATANKTYLGVLGATSSCSTLQCIAGLSAQHLLAVSVPFKWGPVVDQVNLKDTPEELITQGQYNNGAKVLMGSNRDEFAFWSISSVDKNLGEVGFDVTLLGLGVTREEVAELKGLYNFSSGKYIYPGDIGNFSSWWWMLTRIATDAVPGLGACGVRNIARKLVSGGTPSLYVYLFAHPSLSPNNHLPGCGPDAVTVAHATEIPYVFADYYILDKGQEVSLANDMSMYWLEFAKHGVPTGTVDWPEYDVHADQLLRFDVKPVGTKVQFKARDVACNWMDKHRNLVRF